MINSDWSIVNFEGVIISDNDRLASIDNGEIKNRTGSKIYGGLGRAIKIAREYDVQGNRIVIVVNEKFNNNNKWFSHEKYFDGLVNDMREI